MPSDNMDDSGSSAQETRTPGSNSSDEDEDVKTSNHRPVASFSIAHALSMVRKRQEEQKKVKEDEEKALEEEKKEKARAKRKRRRANQKLAKAKAKANLEPQTDGITEDVQDEEEIAKDVIAEQESNQESSKRHMTSEGSHIRLPVKKRKLEVDLASEFSFPLPESTIKAKQDDESRPAKTLAKPNALIPRALMIKKKQS